jgi:hemoglobin-like flavoprotein
MPITPAAFPAHAGHDSGRTARPIQRTVSADDARVVAGSWLVAAARADVLAGAFFANLFSLDPSLRLLFLGESAEQARERERRFVHAVDVAVNNLHRFEARPGEAPVSWDAVGVSLLGALQHVLGVAMTPSVRDAWAAAYAAIATAMRAANGAARSTKAA